MRIGLGLGITGPGASIATPVVGGPSTLSLSSYPLITLTESGTWVCPATGTYRVRCYGACGHGSEGSEFTWGTGGGGGGFGESELMIDIGMECTITIDESAYGSVRLDSPDHGGNYVEGSNGFNGVDGGYGGGDEGYSDPNTGDITYRGGAGGSPGGGLSGAGGTRATEAGNGVTGGGAAGVFTGQNGLSGISLNSGGSGGGIGTTTGGVGGPGYITIQRVS